MGTPEFAVPSLRILIQHQYPIVAVATAPDKPRGRGRQLSPTPVKDVALLHQLPVLQPESLKDPGFAEQIRSLHPELIVVVAFRILPREVFTIPPLGSFNLHASLLPKYRGAAPVNWAIINGEKETGITTFFLQERVDTGSLLLQERIPIHDDDDAETIHDTLAPMGAELVLRTVQLIEQGKARPIIQVESLASPARKILKEDCVLHWDTPAYSIRNRIRGLSPSPGAFTLHHGKVLKIFRSRVLDEKASIDPGTVRVLPNALHVAAADFILAIDELQQEAKRRMTIEEFLRGYRISSGEKFT